MKEGRKEGERKGGKNRERERERERGREGKKTFVKIVMVLANGISSFFLSAAYNSIV